MTRCKSCGQLEGTIHECIDISANHNWERIGVFKDFGDVLPKDPDMLRVMKQDQEDKTPYGNGILVTTDHDTIMSIFDKQRELAERDKAKGFDGPNPIQERDTYDEQMRGQTEVYLMNALRDYLKLVKGLPQESVDNTPQRFVAALSEMTSGYDSSPEEILGKVFEVQCDDLIILRKTSFTSLCSHHMLPFSGTCHIGYVPGKVVGLSKLARLVECFARRFQMQEVMTREIAESIMTYLNAKGAAVITTAVHSCLSCRGIRKEGAEMVCSSMLGAFRDEPSARAEFLNLCRD